MEHLGGPQTSIFNLYALGQQSYRSITSQLDRNQLDVCDHCTYLTFSIGLVTDINQALAIIPAIAGLAAYTYMAINQKFWIQASLLQQENPFENIQRSRTKVDPSWGWVALFAIAEFIIHAIATSFYLGGLFVIFPVIVCISTAAYRQLFGIEDQTGFLSES